MIPIQKVLLFTTILNESRILKEQRIIFFISFFFVYLMWFLLFSCGIDEEVELRLELKVRDHANNFTSNCFQKKATVHECLSGVNSRLNSGNVQMIKC